MYSINPGPMVEMPDRPTLDLSVGLPSSFECRSQLCIVVSTPSSASHPAD
jgi:hypothetical protein